MYPNDTFRMRYPAEWAKVYGEPRLPFEFHIGLYCATLAIGRSTGLYDILQEAMGPKNGNAMMDYAMFLLRSRSSTTQLFAETMRTQALKRSVIRPSAVRRGALRRGSWPLRREGRA